MMQKLLFCIILVTFNSAGGIILQELSFNNQEDCFSNEVTAERVIYETGWQISSNGEGSTCVAKNSRQECQASGGLWCPSCLSYLDCENCENNGCLDIGGSQGCLLQPKNALAQCVFSQVGTSSWTFYNFTKKPMPFDESPCGDSPKTTPQTYKYDECYPDVLNSTRYVKYATQKRFCFASVNRYLESTDCSSVGEVKKMQLGFTPDECFVTEAFRNKYDKEGTWSSLQMKRITVDKTTITITRYSDPICTTRVHDTDSIETLQIGKCIPSNGQSFKVTVSC